MKIKGTRIVSVLLAMVLLASANGFTVLAQSVSDNMVTEGNQGQENPEQENNGQENVQDSSQEAGNQEDEENGIVPGNMTEAGNEENLNQGAGDFSEEAQLDGIEAYSVSGDAIWSGGDNSGNPVHYCDEIVQGSYIYFGSYPQSEVTDSGLIAAIEAAIQNGGEKSEDGIDVWVNGTKYRRISKENITNDKNFGDATYRYFKWERIKWRVLYNNGTSVLVMADKALDCKLYYDGTEIWESSNMRTWLKYAFYKTAFSDNERNAIIMQTMSNEKNPYGKGGNDTKDNIFLLSAADVMNATYGFESNNGYTSKSRLVKASDFAGAMGVYKVPESDKAFGLEPEEYHGNCCWWTRSPGKFNCWMVFVTEKGSVASVGSADKDLGIVPALYLSLSSKSWSMTDDGTSGEGGENRVYASLKASKTKTVYQIGETLNTDDLHVTACYQKHAGKELAAGSYTTNAAAIDMKTPGNKTLTVSYRENGITKTAAVPVTVENITITGPSKKLAAGKKVSLVCKNTESNTVNKQVTWKSSNKKYATVDKNGKITLKKAGAGKSVTITATASGGKTKAVYKIKIMPHSVKSIKLSASKKTLKTGKSMTIKATVKTTGSKVNKTLKWTSSNTSYATVNKKGKVTAKKAGKGKTVTITAKSTDGSGKKASVKVKIQ